MYIYIDIHYTHYCMVNNNSKKSVLEVGASHKNCLRSFCNKIRNPIFTKYHYIIGGLGI